MYRQHGVGDSALEALIIAVRAESRAQTQAAPVDLMKLADDYSGTLSCEIPALIEANPKENWQRIIRDQIAIYMRKMADQATAQAGSRCPRTTLSKESPAR